MNKAELLDRMKDLSFKITKLANDMQKAGIDQIDIMAASEEGAEEYRILIGEEE